jgi:hypothetical protein
MRIGSCTNDETLETVDITSTLLFQPQHTQHKHSTNNRATFTTTTTTSSSAFFSTHSLGYST